MNRDTKMYYVAFYARNYNGVRQRFQFYVNNIKEAAICANKFHSPKFYFGSVFGGLSAQYNTSENL